jgi:hypothetical protein
MNIGSILGATSVALAASATVAFGAVASMPAQLAFADSTPAPSASVADGTLTINGSNAADDITIGVGADPATMQVDLGTGAAPVAFARSTFRAISVYLGQGDDRFSVTPTGQFSDAALTVHGGRGDDSISGSRGNDVLIGGLGDDTIRGNDGNDLIFGGRGDDNVDGEKGADTQILGSGDDTALWNPGEGSDTTDGGGGHDVLVFNGAAGNEKFAVFANGSDAVLTRDLGSIRMDNTGVEQLNLAALGGTDSVAVGDLTGTDLDVANVNLAGPTGASDGLLDTVAVAGTATADEVSVDANGSAVDVSGLHTLTHISGGDVRDQLAVATAEGNDSVAVSDAARALLAISVDVGAGQL